MSSRDRLLGYLKSCAVATGEDLFEGRETPRLACRPGEGEDLTARFICELNASGGEVFDLASRSERDRALGALRMLAGEVSDEHRDCLLDEDPAWSSLAMPAVDVLREAGWRIRSAAPGEASISVLAAQELSATVADLAIAETGTVVQRDQSFRSRGISLVPPRHLVVVPRDRLVASLEDVFDDPRMDPGARGETFTFITGPSRTADIEKVLTIGVHGPGRWLALVLAENGPSSET